MNDEECWVSYQQLQQSCAYYADKIAILKEAELDESKLREFIDLRNLPLVEARKRISDSIEEHNENIMECEKDMDRIAKKLKRGGYDVHAYFIQEALNADKEAWRVAAEREMEEKRPCKVTENNVTRIVPLGSSGYWRDCTKDTDADEQEVEVLDDSAMPLENDRKDVQLNIFSEAADCNGVEEPQQVISCDAIKVQSYCVPGNLARLLKPHQKEAVEQILQRLGVDASGYLLAHSMGLGKTLTTIAVIEALCIQSSECRIVVACPKSCVFNWFCEMERWEDALSFDFYQPIDDDIAFRTNIRRWSKKGGVIIMGHERFRICQDSDKPLEFECLVFDEAHKLKNPATNLYKAVEHLKVSRKLLLTGSPLQNHLTEYGAMIRLVDSFLFDESTFKKDFAMVIDRGMLADASTLDMSKARTQIAVLTRMTEGIVNRRSSNLLKQALPPMREFKLTYKAPHPTIGSSGVFGLKQSTITSSLKNKVSLACSIIKEIQSQTRDKILVFSWRKDALQSVCDKVPGLLMDGTNTDLQRQNMIESFQNGEWDIFYMTTKVGNVGLNLYMANRILILDPAWNPTDDKQACFRAYRYGQTKPVYIYRLIVYNSIEERIYRLAVHKNLAACRIVDERDVARHFTQDQLMNVDDFKEYKLDKSKLNTMDPILSVVLPKLVSCSSHDILFADAEEEKLSDAEMFDAENQCNLITSLQPMRNLLDSNGVSRTIASDAIRFEDGVLVPPFPMSYSLLDPRAQAEHFATYGSNASFIKTFNPIVPLSPEIISHDVEFESLDHAGRAENFIKGQETHWPLEFGHRGSYRVRSRANTKDGVSAWSEWSATVVV